jgi:peroxiredoxin
MKLLLAIAMVGILSAFSTTVTGPGQELKAGADAPAFKLKNIDGKMVSLADYKSGKGAVVVFTCNHCPYAIAYEDRIVALDKKYKALGYPVIAINPNDVTKEPGDSFDKMKERAAAKGFTFPYLHDESQAVAHAYGASKTPHVYVVTNQGGKQVITYVGTIDDSARNASAVSKKYLEDALDALIAGKKPATDYTTAIGCTIKWADA